MKTTITLWCVLLCLFYRESTASSNSKLNADNTIQLISPHGGERFLRGQKIKIRWTDQSGSSHVLIYLNDKQLVKTDNDGVYDWDVPSSYPLGEYKVKILNYEGEDATSRQPITISAKCKLEGGHQAVKEEHIEGLYYSKLSTETGKKLLRTKGTYLAFYFEEHYAASVNGENKFEGTIYDWKRNELLHLSLNKKSGANYYAVDLSKTCGAFKFGDEVYELVTKDLNNKVYRLRFQFTPAPELTGNIAYDAKSWNCQSLDKNEIDFIGDIKGGTAPYTIEWYISPSASTERYFKKETDIDDGSGNDRASITSFEQPIYYVIMEVKDMCGQELKKIAHIQCTERKDPTNSLIFQIMDENNTKPSKSNTNGIKSFSNSGN